MSNVIFQHPNVTVGNGTLTVATGANQIYWSYGLNTQTYPTYGGEVVQILSTFIDDLIIEGDCKTYKEMEHIYAFFLEYIQIATQNEGPGSPRFVETPMTFSYPERGWKMLIRPSQLPGYRLATDVVAASWQLQAAVVEDDPEVAALTMAEAEKRGFDFTHLHAGIGYDPSNPWTDPAAGKSNYDPKNSLAAISDFYRGLIPAYLNHDFSTLTNRSFFSRPVGGSTTPSATTKNIPTTSKTAPNTTTPSTTTPPNTPNSPPVKTPHPGYTP